MASESKEEGTPEHINLKVMGQDGNIVQFKIKKHTALKKLMATYCERAGLALQTIRFSFDGTRINETDTPKSLDMEDGDTIEVFQQPSGGGGGRSLAGCQDAIVPDTYWIQGDV
jgi:small ubiquitin-related modifier